MIGALDENENLTHLGMYSFEEKNNLFHEKLYCFYDVLFTSYIYDLYSDFYKLYLRHFLQPGKFLAILPVDPKLGKMLIMGTIFRCFDPVLTIVAGLSVRDPFLLPQDKKDVSRKQFAPLALPPFNFIYY